MLAHRLLARLANERLPVFVARRSKMRLLRRLAAVGHLEVRFYPPEPCAGQFGEVRALTRAGQAAVQDRVGRRRKRPGG
jgi:hypothetical protein